MRRDSLVAQHYPPGLFAATLPITQAPHRVQHYKPWPIEMLELWLTHADPCLTHVVRFLAATRLRISDALRVTQQQADDGQNGIKLWVTDGTETGTVMVENIPPSSGAIRQVAVELNGSLIFEADDSSSIGRELWITDGTSSGTQLLLNINQSGAGEATKWLGKINGKQLFSADMGANGIQLWVTDGTANGTILLKDIERNDSVVLGDRMYLSADDGVTGNELWVTDGSPAGTTILKDINLTQGQGSDPDELKTANGLVFFEADDGTGSGNGLWVTDGTADGTKLLKEFNQNGEVTIDEGVEFNSSFYFIADEGVNGFQMWVSNGTESGTQLVQNNLDQEYDLIPALGSLFFNARDQVLGTGNELWVTDGTEEGTYMVRDINLGGDSFPDSHFEFNDRLFISADDGVHGWELWAVS